MAARATPPVNPRTARRNSAHPRSAPKSDRRRGTCPRTTETGHGDQPPSSRPNARPRFQSISEPGDEAVHLSVCLSVCLSSHQGSAWRGARPTPHRPPGKSDGHLGPVLSVRVLEIVRPGSRGGPFVGFVAVVLTLLRDLAVLGFDPAIGLTAFTQHVRHIRPPAVCTTHA